MHLYKKNKKLSDYGLAISFVIFAAVIIFFFTAISNMSGDLDSQQKQALIKAIDNAVVCCYAVEGSYPDSIEYLEEHYGLYYDHDKYLVDYSAFGSNIRPVINVVVLKDGRNKQ